MAFLLAQLVNSLLANTGNPREMGSSPGPGRSPGEGNGNPFQYFLPGESHGQRSLVGYGLWGRKECGMLSTPTRCKGKQWKFLGCHFADITPQLFLSMPSD